MKTKEFINLLKENPNKELLFEYSNNLFASTNYHLTEIKKVFFDTVDCGGNPNQWNETHIQIWESPNEIGNLNFMTTDKISSIIEKVNQIKPLNFETELKVEYGNTNFHTAVMIISTYKIKNNQLIIQLFEEKTLCKAPSNPKDNKQETTCCSSTSCC